MTKVPKHHQVSDKEIQQICTKNPSSTLHCNSDAPYVFCIGRIIQDVSKNRLI